MIKLSANNNESGLQAFSRAGLLGCVPELERAMGGNWKGQQVEDQQTTIFESANPHVNAGCPRTWATLLSCLMNPGGRVGGALTSWPNATCRVVAVEQNDLVGRLVAQPEPALPGVVCDVVDLTDVLRRDAVSRDQVGGRVDREGIAEGEGVVLHGAVDRAPHAKRAGRAVSLGSLNVPTTLNLRQDAKAVVFLMVEVLDLLVRREMAPDSVRAALLGVVC